MSKNYYSLGLMSGTSGDGVDASIIKSDGNTKYEVILDKYYKYTDEIYKEYTNLKNAIMDDNDHERYFSLYENSLFIFSSYSGNTEETISCFNIALKINKPHDIVTIDNEAGIPRFNICLNILILKLKFLRFMLI